MPLQKALPIFIQSAHIMLPHMLFIYIHTEKSHLFNRLSNFKEFKKTNQVHTFFTKIPVFIQVFKSFQDRLIDKVK